MKVKFKIVLIAGIMFTILGCDKYETTVENNVLPNLIESKGILVKVNYRDVDLIVLKKDGKYYIDDDCLLFNSDIKSEVPYEMTAKESKLIPVSSYSLFPVTVWPDNTIPYKIDGSIAVGCPLYTRIIAAVKYWNSTAPIELKENPSDPSALNFKRVATGCATTIGYSATGAYSNLSDECDPRSVTHEIGHAVGLKHEHVRGIRDNFLKIDYRTMDFFQNIYLNGAKWGTIVNNVFNKQDVTLDGLTAVDNFPFDFKSLMLYGSYPVNDQGMIAAMTTNVPPLPFYTKVSTGSEVPRPTIAELSSKDIDLVRKMYPLKLTIFNLNYSTLNCNLRNLYGNLTNYSLPTGNSMVLTHVTASSRNINSWQFNGNLVTAIQLDQYDNDNVISFLNGFGVNYDRINYVQNSVKKPIINKFFTPTVANFYETIDRNGIDGKGVLSVSAYKANAKNLYIILSIWRDMSTVFTNADRHVFDPNKLTTIRVMNDLNVDIPLKIRLEGAYDKSFNVRPNTFVDFVWKNEAKSILYNNSPVQQIGLNGNSSTDVINGTWTATDTVTTYNSGDPNENDNFLISRGGYYHGLLDMNGIGNIITSPVYIKPELTNSGTVLIIHISPFN